MPDQFRTTLRWWKSDPINLTVVSTAGTRYNASGAFDPDPGAGSTTSSGYRQLAHSMEVIELHLLELGLKS